jgi:RimJ/RimL family protein N-acetyltransferase
VLDDARVRPATSADLTELVALQEAAAVVAFADIFPQDRFPFPRAAILERWQHELADPAVAVYVSLDDAGNLTGFAARREDELLHFGTALNAWGSGAATDLHDALIESYPATVVRIWLRVMADNHRGRRFWQKLGWRPTGGRSQSPFAPYPVLLEYELLRPRARD